MQKCLFSAPDRPAGPGGREIHLVPPPAAPSTAAAEANAVSTTAPDAPATGHPANGNGNNTQPVNAPGVENDVAPVDAKADDQTPAAPTLVWPPPDEELDDWHVIPLRRPDADAAAAAAAAEARTAAGDATVSLSGTAAGASTATPPRKPLPAWLANHRASQTGSVGSSGAGSSGISPRALAPSASGNAVRAVSPSPLEDTARLSGDTTTAITARRRPSASAGTTTALNLAPAAQPVARPVAAFPSGQRRVPPRPQPSPWTGVARRAAVVVLALLAVGQAAYIGARLFMTSASAMSILTVDSNPDGAEVFINGERRGVTPFKVELPAGEHALELRKNGRTRAIPVVMAAGVQASQYVELGSAPLSATPRPAAPPEQAPASSSGPSGQGSGSPTGPAAGPAALTTAAAAAPGTAVTPTPPVATRGWVVVESGLNLRVLRNGEMLGSSEEGRLALPAGRQELELVNDAVGYRAVMTVQVPPGRATTLPVELPQSLLNVSATPSARVWVDGREVGNTPVRQLALPVGQHEVRFEHPDYGERRMTVLVRVGTTTQATVDFTRE
jgi:hypothetical protein